MKQIDIDLLFAQFMGLSVSEQHGEILYADWDGMHSVKYDSSWDWLMPVWLKAQKWYAQEFGLMTSTFEASSVGISITAKSPSAFKCARIAYYGELTMKDFYTTMVDFLKWKKEYDN